MKYKRLANLHDLTVSELGFGASAIGGNHQGNSYGPTDDTTSSNAIQAALELGCTFFDTADVYGHGHSEVILGRALQSANKLNEVVIATKVGGNFYQSPLRLDYSPKHINRAIDASLRRLGRDFIDLYQLHNPTVEVMRDSAVLCALEALRISGKIRHYGVSINTVDEGLAALEIGQWATIQLPYNLLSSVDPGPNHGDFFSKASVQSVGVIAREPLANGFLSGKHNLETCYGLGDMRAEWSIGERRLRIQLTEALRFLERPGITLAQAALRFAIDQPGVTTTIVGIKTPEQAKENFRAASLPSFEELFGPRPFERPAQSTPDAAFNGSTE